MTMIPRWTHRVLPGGSRGALAVAVLAATLTAATPALAADQPDLKLTIGVSDASIPLGDTVDLTYSLSNIGKVAVGDARLEGTITGAHSLSIISQPSGQPNNCTLSGTALTCTGLVLGVSDVATVKVRATASSSTPGTISASGTADPNHKITESNESNNAAASKVTVFRLADLKATIQSGPTIVKGGADVQFKVLVQNLGGSTSHIDLDFRTTSGLVYDSVSFVNNVTHGFKCDLHNPAFGTNYVSCSGGSLGEPNVNPANDESVTLLIGATVKDRGLTSKDRTVTVKVDPNHTISESNESNNSDTFTYHYD
jgi:hypothetical protein